MLGNGRFVCATGTGEASIYYDPAENNSGNCQLQCDIYPLCAYVYYSQVNKECGLYDCDDCTGGWVPGSGNDYMWITKRC